MVKIVPIEFIFDSCISIFKFLYNVFWRNLVFAKMEKIGQSHN